MALQPPANYMLNYVDPFDSFMKGVKTRQVVDQARLQQQQREAELQRQAQAQAQQEAMNREMATLMNNPNATLTDYQKVASMLPPEQQKGVLKMWDMKEKDYQQGMLNFGGQVMAAFNAGENDMAIDLLKKRSEAAKNKGDEEQAQAYDTLARLAEVNPKYASSSMGVMIATVPGGDKVLENISKEKKYGLEYEKLMDEKEKNKLRVIEAELRRTDSELKRQELQLKIDEIKQKAQQKGQERQVEAESAIGTFETTLDTVDKVLNHPAFETATGWSSFMAAIPGTESKDFASLVDTLKSKLFTMQVKTMRGMGSLTETEGKKLVDSVQNLDRSQTSEAFRNNILEIKKYIEKGLTGAKTEFQDVLPEEQPAGQAIEPGTIEEGYRFKGGNPADPNSWEKV